MKEIVSGRGHINIQAIHKATLEFTKDKYVSRNGDCIVAVGTDKGVADLSREFRENLADDNAKIIILIEAGSASEQITARGSSRLTFTHAKDMVIRKSDYVCSRTLAVHADKTAKDISRNLVEKLKNPEQDVKITLTIYL